MGKRVTFTVTAESTAARPTIFRLLRDGSTWPRWTPIGSFSLERPGTDGLESVGAIRRFRTGAVTSREELLALEPDRSISYTALSGLPIRNHRADVELTDRPAGTLITWREDFQAKIPGTAAFIHWFLRLFMQRCANGLARHAAKPDAG
jgi:hypothetical protein